MRLNFIPKIAKDLTRKGCQNSWQIFEVWIILGSFGHCMTRKGNSPLHHVIIGNLKRWLFFAAKFIWTNKQGMLYASICHIASKISFTTIQQRVNYVLLNSCYRRFSNNFAMGHCTCKEASNNCRIDPFSPMKSAVFSTEKLLLLTIQTY